MKITIAYAFVCILIFGLIFTSCQKSVDNSAADIQALKASVTALQKRSDSLAAALAITNSNIGTLGKSVDSIRVQLSGISYQIGLLTTQLTTVNANVTAINAQISELNQKYIDLLAKLNAIVAQFTNTTAYLNARIDSLSASIVRMQKTSDSLKNALATTNNNLNNYSRSVDTIKIQLVFIVTQINQFTIQLNTTNANIPLINAQITLLNQQYADLLAKLNDILALLNTSPTTLTTGLVAYYPFTGNAVDSSGNGNNGTVVGAKSSSDRFGNANSAYIFDGISNFIDLGNIKGLNTNQGLSIAIWINWSGLNGISNDQYAFSMGPNPNASLTFDNNNTLTGNVVNCNCASDIPTTTNITSNNWFFVTLNYDLQSGTQKLYINGKLVSTSIENMFSYYRTNSGSTTIGKYWYNSAYFKGSIDDIKIYNRVLTQSEITYLATH